MLKILVVDDETQIRELLRRALSAEHIETVTVPTAAQALARLQEEPFGAVLLDVRIPDESGISLLKKIRSLDAKLPVIIYSGLLTKEIEAEAMSAGANEVLSKNINLLTLVAKIKKIVRAKENPETYPMADQRTILLVDDEPSIRKMLGIFFKGKGHKVLEAGSGEEALKLVAFQKISVVLLDIDMPNMDGIATLEKIRQIDASVGVVMATGSQDDERISKAFQLGAFNYVLKPFDFIYLELVVGARLLDT